ncbi:MAG: hypothetical protein ABJH82_06865 [Polaribacter sp.]|uniref:hypothetical protein n=1 Tax=Polaribacter sp. TaxID=1920175 RepID=UPI00326547A8
MKNKIITFLLLIYSITCFSQKEINWQDLSKVTFTDKYFKEYKGYFKYPTFSASIKALEGKRITLKGYFLDIIQAENVFILSKGPMASCFFCGAGGPETAVEIQYINTKNFKTDDIVSITGTLKLNSSDVMHFNYILKNCVVTLLEK